MRNFDSKQQPPRRSEERSTENFNRDDSRLYESNGYSQFAKDRRTRTTSVQKVTPGPRSDRGEGYRPHRAGEEGQRRSFNPNFTRDNRPAFRSDDQHNDRRTGYDTRREGHAPRTDKPFRSSGYGSKPYAGRSDDSYREYGRSDRRETGGRPAFRSDDKPSYGGKFAKSDRSRTGGYNKPERNAPHSGRNFNGRGGESRGERKPASYPKFAAPKQEGAMRLNRFIAQSGLCSRREADTYIQAGVVSVNGQIVTELGVKIMPGDQVRFNDEPIHGEKKVYIVMNKPKGFVTTIEDPHADKTVMDLVKGACEERVYPVGRLDKNSLGVLLITNDGDLTRLLTHPSYEKKKIYQVSLDKPLSKSDMEQLVEGLVLEDGEVHADQVSYVGESRKEVGVEIHSGRNRIVRRMFDHLGYTVTKLDRVYFAGLTKKNLKRGAWRFLTPKEVSALKSGLYE
ncbi:MAG: rRNA pseudouridine synthase [Rikenellaceae bacterium]|nr:rRNA pseudouridine synthase [Rikenellaceae bacterium]